MAYGKKIDAKKIWPWLPIPNIYYATARPVDHVVFVPAGRARSCRPIIGSRTLRFVLPDFEEPGKIPTVVRSKMQVTVRVRRGSYSPSKSKRALAPQRDGRWLGCNVWSRGSPDAAFNLSQTPSRDQRSASEAVADHHVQAVLSCSACVASPSVGKPGGGLVRFDSGISRSRDGLEHPTKNDSDHIDIGHTLRQYVGECF